MLHAHMFDWGGVWPHSGLAVPAFPHGLYVTRLARVTRFHPVLPLTSIGSQLSILIVSFVAGRALERIRFK